jgi:hypothetical protein
MNITGDSLSGGMYDLLDSTMAVSGSGSSSAISDEIFQSIMADPITNFLENTSSYHPTNYDGGSLGFNAHEDLISHLSANDHSTTSVPNENNNSGFTIGGYDDVLANLLDMDGTGGRNSLTTSLSSILLHLLLHPLLLDI